MKRFTILSVLALLCGAALPVAADDVPGVPLPCVSTMEGNSFLFFGGVPNTNQGENSRKVVDFDLGSLKTITGIRFLTGDYWSMPSSLKNLVVFASADGETWEQIFDNGGVTLEISTYYDGVVDADHHGPYRYFRAESSDPKAKFIGLSDFRALSEELAIEAKKPSTFISSNHSVSGEPQTNVVTFSGKVLAAPRGSARVYAAVAKQDLGLSLASWQTGGTVFDLGEFAADADFSVEVEDIPADSYKCRYFAVSGTDTYPSPLVFDFTPATKPFFPSGYIYKTDAPIAMPNQLYDANLAKGSYAQIPAGACAVFPLDEMEDGDVLSTLRIWASPTDYYPTMLNATVEYSWDDVDLKSTATETVIAEGRSVWSLAEFPEMTWVSAGAFTNWAERVEYYHPGKSAYVTAGYAAWEFAVDRELAKGKPKFLRIRFVYGSPAYIVEIEPRVTTLPPEPEGAAQVYEVGSAYVKASGRLVTRGNAGSDCEIIFEAVPKAGGSTVRKTIVASLTTRESFDVTVLGVKPETEYDWQIVAKNAQTESVLGAGTLTTLEGGGAAPSVEFLDAVANDDGTVTVSYNLTYAGDGYETADVYLCYGTSSDDLSGKVLAVAGVLGEGTVVVSGLPHGRKLYLALSAKNAGNEECAPTAQRDCTTVGPCGLTDVAVTAEGCFITVSGTLAPRGLGPVDIYLDYGEASGNYTLSTKVGTVAVGDPDAFSVTAPVSRLPRIWGRVRAVNAIDGDSWTFTDDAEYEFVLGAKQPCTTTTGGQSFLIFSGVLNGGANGVPVVDFDIGEPKTITGVKFLPSTSGFAERNLKNFTISASLDGVNYVQIFANDGRPTPAGVYMSYPVDSEHTGPYRYFRAATPYDISPSLWLSDLRVLSMDLAIAGRKPTSWSDRTAFGEEPLDGVTFSGSLPSAPGGSAHVYVAYARNDCGLSLADWRASGRAVDLGEIAEGASFSEVVRDIPAGNYKCRYFAVSGDDECPGPDVFNFTSGSKLFCPSCIYMQGASTVTSCLAFDQNLGTYYNMPDGSYMVLPLDEMDAGDVISCLRFWESTGYFVRMIDTRVEFSWDDVDLESISTESVMRDGLSVRTVTAFPAMNWTPAGGFVNRDEFPAYVALADNGAAEEFTVDRALALGKPKFLRVCTGAVYGAEYIRDFELRVTTVPPEPEGTARVDEVGSSYAKVSGGISFCGSAASGGCTVTFEAVPTAGGETVQKTLEGTFAVDDAFEVTVLGLKPETEYAWQVVAENGQAAGPLGEGGTFTTSEGGGVSPVVEFVDAVPNADGSVSVSYNLTSAGDGYDEADVYLHYGTDPDHLSETKLIAEGTLGAGTAAVSGLPLDTTVYLALTAKNAGDGESEMTEVQGREMPGPCGLEDVIMSAEGFRVTVCGRLAPRGVGAVEIYLDYGAGQGVLTETVKLGTVAVGEPDAFEMSGTVALRRPTVWCRVRAVNAVGAYSWTATSEETSHVLGAALPCLPLPVAGNPDSNPANFFTGIYGLNQGASQIDFDVGVPKTVTGFKFMAGNVYYAQTGLKNFKLSASADGVTYETIFANEGRTVLQDGVYMTYPLSDEFAGPYRFFRVIATESSLSINDFRMLTSELALEGHLPEHWDGAFGVADGTGVTFRGRLLSAPAGSARVYVAYAKRDQGNSLAAWRARGTLIDAGTVAESEEFSVSTEDIAPGTYAFRYIAVSGEDEYVTPYAYDFSVGTVPFYPSRMFLVAADATGDNVTMLPAYDGDTTTSSVNVRKNCDVVFPMDEIPEGWRLASVRVWSRRGYTSGILALRLSASSDSVDLDAGASVMRTVNDRTVKDVGAFPEMSWSAIGCNDNSAAIVEYFKWSESLKYTEIRLDPSVCRRKPRFLRINRGKYENTFDLGEVEFRLVREKGFSVIVK